MFSTRLRAALLAASRGPSLPRALALALLLPPACRHEVDGGRDAGVAGEGEGEGGGEGEGEGEGEGDCPSEPVLGMTAIVIDNVTQFRVCDATVEIQEGSFVETLEQQGSSASDCRYVGAEDRPGIYQVRASAAGYVDFDVSGITVEADTCGKPVPETVNVRLTPE